MTLGQNTGTAYLLSGLLHAAVLCAALRVPAPSRVPQFALPAGPSAPESLARPATVSAEWTATEETPVVELPPVATSLDRTEPLPVLRRRPPAALPAERIPEPPLLRPTVAVRPDDSATTISAPEARALAELRDRGEPTGATTGIRARGTRVRSDLPPRGETASATELLKAPTRRGTTDSEKRMPARSAAAARSPAANAEAFARRLADRLATRAAAAVARWEQLRSFARRIAGPSRTEPRRATEAGTSSPAAAAQDARQSEPAVARRPPQQQPESRPSAERPHNASERQTAEPVATRPTASPQHGGPADSSASRSSDRRRGAVFDDPPRALPTNPPPEYPPESLAAGEQGRTLLKVSIDPHGRVQDANVHRSSGYPRLDAGALQAVRRWRFVPARRDGRPVRCEVLVPVRFQIRPRSAAD
ncbi:MAG: TonB family protein [Planctomycetota bacterium]|nr:MAG: TonB family protein [Planctomycetota bacterium]